MEDYRALRKQQGAAEKSRFHETNLIKQLLNWSYAHGIITENPLRLLKLRKV